MQEDQDLGEFVDQLDKTILLRNPVGDGKWTDTISLPYGSCKECGAISSDKEPVRGRVSLYDMVDLAQNFEHGVSADKIAEFAPYVTIVACDSHIKRAVEDCFKGTFEYHETGKDPLRTRAFNNILIHVENSDGLSKVKLSYPIHPELEGISHQIQDMFLYSKK